MFVIHTHVESCCRVQLASMQNLLGFRVDGVGNAGGIQLVQLCSDLSFC